MNPKFSRRQLIVQMARAAAFAPVGSVLFDTLMAQVMNRALAAGNNVTGADEKLLFQLSLYLAPPRWYFDLPLAPMGVSNSTFTPGGFGTRFDAGKPAAVANGGSASPPACSCC